MQEDMTGKKELSIVTTLYSSSVFIAEFHSRIVKSAEKITNDFEIIFVVDGSPDDSCEKAIEVQKKDPRVIVLDLSRNFGHHRAMMSGLAHARGKKVFLIDADLEEEPELLEKFNNELNSASGDVVYGVQDSRKGGLFERFSGFMFYKLFNLLSSYPIPANLTTARLMTARYVRSLLQYTEREIFIPGLWVLAGFNQIPLPIHKSSKGATAYTFRKKISLFVNAVTSFSDRPLIFIFYLGTGISILTSFYICYLFYLALFRGIPVMGWASLLVSIWFLGGLMVMSVGILGIYLSKVFNETKNRPYVTIRASYPPRQ